MQSSVPELSVRPCLEIASRLLYNQPYGSVALPNDLRDRLIRYDRTFRSEGWTLTDPNAISLIIHSWFDSLSVSRKTVVLETVKNIDNYTE